MFVIFRISVTVIVSSEQAQCLFIPHKRENICRPVPFSLSLQLGQHEHVGDGTHSEQRGGAEVSECGEAMRTDAQEDCVEG